MSSEQPETQATPHPFRLLKFPTPAEAPQAPTLDPFDAADWCRVFPRLMELVVEKPHDAACCLRFLREMLDYYGITAEGLR